MGRAKTSSPALSRRLGSEPMATLPVDEVVADVGGMAAHALGCARCEDQT